MKPKGSQAARAATADRRARKHGGGKKTSASAASAASQPSEPCERSEHSRERSERSEPARERSEPASASAASLPRTSAASLRVHSLDETDRLLKDVPTTIVAAGGARGRRDHRLLGQAIAFSCAGGEMGKMPPPLAVFGGNRTCGKAIAARAAAWRSDGTTCVSDYSRST